MEKEYPFDFVGQDYNDVSKQELRDAITLLIEHLNVKIVRTTDHKGSTELKLEPK